MHIFKNLLIYLFASIIFLLIFIPSKYEAVDSSKNFYFSLSSFISIAFYLYVSRKIYKSWVRFDVFFLIGFIIVHFQIPFLFSVGILPSDPDFVFLNMDLVNFATWLSAMVIHVWLFASAIGHYQMIKKNMAKKLKIQNKFIYDVRKLDVILIISFVLFAGMMGPTMLTGSYRGIGSGGELASYVIIILRVCLYLRTFLFFKNLKKISLYQITNNNIIFLSVLFAYFTLFLLSGDRGPFLQILIVSAFCYGIFTKSISFKYLLAAVVMGSILLSIIGMGRGDDSSMFTSGYESYKESETLATEELATSVRIMYRALEYFPEKMEYLNGVQLILGLSGAVPFLSGFVVKSLNVPQELLSSSSLFTFIGQGGNATYGEGTEIISDLYINVGFVGLFIIMFFYGYLTSRLSFSAVIMKSDKLMLVLIVFVSTALYISRAQFITPMKDIIYIMVIFQIISKKIAPR